MASRPPNLLTISKVATALGIPAHRVHYVVRTRQIEPAAYAGHYRLFDRQIVARIRHEINAIDARREGVIRG